MKGKNYDRVLLFIAVTVTVLWGATIVIQTIFPSHPTPDSVNQVMIIVATAFFGGAVVGNLKRKNGKNGDDENGD